MPHCLLFQSLRGFGVDWSTRTPVCRRFKNWFQSLRGFGVDWSLGCGLIMTSSEKVSIPERVWGGLEPSQWVAAGKIGTVSIPERVWGGLERT
ncbi:hypothetical protein GFS31_43820 (plasmid) [Leptolyngbya sp. BL0902]|nr:hypothetical protein GFS31_43820 [Leptolyngbya sp. BL0902]